MEDSLKDKIVKGTFWHGLERFGTAFFLFISNLVLARFLSPDDFGCIGMLMVFISISDAIVDGGFGAALVQKKQISSVDYSTIFIWNIFVSIVLYCILFLCAPIIADFYQIESLTLILRVQGIVLFLHGLCVVQRSMLQKNMMFKKLAKVNVSATILGTVLGICCAYIGLGVWSLVVKFLFTALMTTVILWGRTKWKPIFGFSRDSFRSLFSFGSFMFLTSITNSIYQNAISLVIGKGLSSAILGYFTQARKLEDVPRQVLISIVKNVSFPAFAVLQNDNTKLIIAVKKTSQILSFVNFSTSILFIIIARPFILLLFSTKWEQSISYFQIICIAGLIMSIFELNISILKSIGESKLIFLTGLMRKSLGIALIIGGGYWGINGILFGYVLSQFLSYLIVTYPLKVSIGYGIKDQLLDMIPGLIVTIISGIVTYYISLFFFSELINIFKLICITVCYIIILISISSIFNIQGAILLKEVMYKRYIHKK